MNAMKTTTFKSELKSLDALALNERLDGLRRELFSLRLKVVTEGVANSSQFKILRKNIARILTAQRQMRASK